VGLERGPLSLVSTTEVLLGRRSNGFGLESRVYGRGYPSRDTPLFAYLALTSPTSGGRSVGIVCSWTQATEFSSSSLMFFMIPDCIRGSKSHIPLIYVYVFLVVSFLPYFTPIPYMYSSHLPCVLHSLSSQSSLT
jgi:hypothetical protein